MDRDELDGLPETFIEGLERVGDGYRVSLDNPEFLHHRPEQPWAGSARRNLLLRLLFGCEDWTADAAAFALVVGAWRFPAQRAQVADVVTQRYAHAAKALGRRPTQLHDPLARVLLLCPGVDPKIARQARKALAGQHQAAQATDTGQLKQSLLRRLKRHNDR